MDQSTIVLDCDGVLADLVGALAKDFGFDPEIVTGYDLKSVFGPKWFSMVDRIDSEGWCSQIPMYEGAQELYEGLKKLGRVIIATGPWNSKTWCYERTQWLRERFPNPEIVFCKNKSDIVGDLLIEDRVEMINDWLNSRYTCDNAILVDRPWNRYWSMCKPDYSRLVRRVRFNDVLMAAQEILALHNAGPW